MRAFKAETMVSPSFSLSYECILPLKGSKKFILMIIKYVSLQNIFFLFFNSQKVYIEI